MSGESSTHITILGVRHPDRQVPSIAPEFVNNSVDGVFHESPISESNLLQYLVWQLLKHPLGILIGTIRLLRYFVVQLVILGEILGQRKRPQVQWENGQAQGLNAARNLANDLGTEVESVDMNRVERVKSFPIKLSIFSWFGTLLGVSAVSIILANPSVGGLVAFSLLFAFVTVVASRISDEFRPYRDEFMWENISESIDENGFENVVLFTGENHVPGLSTHATADGVDSDCYWLSSLGELREEE
ncbi:hypothetical protein [Haloarcula brevis]|uniref:hypothetical protein n=1 Tax=Haloarcula brevis TaxID=3111453 RepID=UPI00300EF7D5